MNGSSHGLTAPQDEHIAFKKSGEMGDFSFKGKNLSQDLVVEKNKGENAKKLAKRMPGHSRRKNFQ